MSGQTPAPRVGYLADGDPATDLMTAVYEHDETGVRLHVPFLSHADLRARWWSHGTVHMDDPDKSRYAYDSPSELDYYDAVGSVGLVHCAAAGATRSFPGGVGRGTISATYAVERARRASNYVEINGLQSEIDGLAYWLAYSAHETTVTQSPDGGPVEITTTLRPVDALPLARRLNLAATVMGTAPGGWSPEVAYRSRVFIETHVKEPRGWETHLSLHMAVRNLLRVAAWRAINFESHRACSSKEATVLGDREYREWREVRTATTGITEGAWNSDNRFLFYFSDIGTNGIARWLRLAERYERGIEPLVRLLDLEGATVDAVISQLGIAIEAVGYQALIDSGTTAAAANKVIVEKRIDHLLDEVKGHVSFPKETFAADFAASYNSVKHANRAPVAWDVKLTHYRQGVELLRVWIALRLGVKPSVLAARR